MLHRSAVTPEANMSDNTFHASLLAALLALGACVIDATPIKVDAAPPNPNRDSHWASAPPAAPTIVAWQVQPLDNQSPITTMETVGASPRD
jgi:hypothetical protein